MATSKQYIGSTSYVGTGSGGSYTFNDVALGNLATDRLTILCLFASSGSPDITGIAVNGYPLAKVVEQAGSTEMWAGYVPDGEIGDILITKASTSALSVRVAVYAAYGVSDKAEATDTSTANNMAMSLDVTSEAVIIAFGSYNSGIDSGSFTWNGVAEDVDQSNGGGVGSTRVSAASAIAESEQSGYAITASTSGFGASDRRAVSASFPARDPGETRVQASAAATAGFSGAFVSSAGRLASSATSSLQATSAAIKKASFSITGSASSALEGDNTFPTVATDWIFPTQGRADDSAGTAAWSNPGNITEDDSSNATASGSNNATTQYLVADTFNLNDVLLGDDKFLYAVGIEVEVQWNLSGTLADGRLGYVNIGKDDETLGTPKAGSAYDFGEVTDTLGDPRDLWGLESLTRADLIASTFQARIAFTQLSGLFGSATAQVDYIAIRVHYKRAHYNFVDAVLSADGSATVSAKGNIVLRTIASMIGKATAALKGAPGGAWARAYFFGG